MTQVPGTQCTTAGGIYMAPVTFEHPYGWGWVVNWPSLLAVEHRGARMLLAAILSQLDLTSAAKSQLAWVNTPEIRDLGHRQVRWKALNELENLGLIRRVSKNWDCVMVNPVVVHPSWLTGEDLRRVIHEFLHIEKS